MAKDIKVSFVGAGYMTKEHARAFRGLPGVGLAGIFSRTPERAHAVAAEFGMPAVCASVGELFERTRADLVVVTVPELSMNEASAQCFRHPWAVLLEKPAGYNLADAEAIVQKAEDSGARKRTYVALNRRAYHSTRQALSLLEETHAEPRFIVVQDQQDMALAGSLGQPEEVVKHWMFANSIHTIDYFHVFGRGELTGVTHVHRWDFERPGIVVAKLEYASGDIGLYQGIWNGPGPWAVAVTTPTLRVEMRPLEALALQRRGERKLQPIDADPADVEYKPGLRFQAQQAVRAVRGQDSMLATLDQSMDSMRLCARIFEV